MRKDFEVAQFENDVVLFNLKIAIWLHIREAHSQAAGMIVTDSNAIQDLKQDDGVVPAFDDPTVAGGPMTVPFPLSAGLAA
jgi:hypothetical protein